MRRLVSLAPLSLNSPGPRDLIDAAVAGGFNAVSLRVRANQLPAAHALLGNPTLQRETKQQLDAVGLSVLAMLSYRAGPEGVEPDLSEAAELGARLGARFVVITAWDDNRERLVENLGRARELAAGAGLRLVLEYMVFSAVRNLAAALDVAHQADVLLLVDALHMARSGGKPAELATVEQGRIAYSQICDASARTDLDPLAEAKNGRCDPGQGELPLVELLRALPPGIALEHEAPDPRLAALSFDERGRLAGNAMRDLLKRAMGAQSRNSESPTRD